MSIFKANCLWNFFIYSYGSFQDFRTIFADTYFSANENLLIYSLFAYKRIIRWGYCYCYFLCEYTFEHLLLNVYVSLFLFIAPWFPSFLWLFTQCIWNYPFIATEGGYNLFFSCNRAFHHRQGCWHPQHLFWKVKLLKKDIKSITIFELYAFSICYLVKQLWEHYQSRWLNLSSSLDAYLWVLLNHVQILDCKT